MGKPTRKSDVKSEKLLAALQAEGLVSFAAAVKHARLGDKANHNLIRWHVHGCLAEDGSRVYLEAVRIGSRFRTSHAAVQRFILSINASAD